MAVDLVAEVVSVAAVVVRGEPELSAACLTTSRILSRWIRDIAGSHGLVALSKMQTASTDCVLPGLFSLPALHCPHAKVCPIVRFGLSGQVAELDVRDVRLHPRATCACEYVLTNSKTS